MVFGNLFKILAIVLRHIYHLSRIKQYHTVDIGNSGRIQSVPSDPLFRFSTVIITHLKFCADHESTAFCFVGVATKLRARGKADEIHAAPLVAVV